MAKYESAMKGISAVAADASKIVEYLELDLGSLSSVKKDTETFLAQNDRLDLLMNNARIWRSQPN